MSRKKDDRMVFGLLNFHDNICFKSGKMIISQENKIPFYSNSKIVCIAVSPNGTLLNDTILSL